MPDVFTKEERSQIMKSVRSKGNKSTEEALISFFHEQHISGWKRNYMVKGHPDFVFLQQRIAIFVDGCFWHGHDCRNTRPSSNQDYWENKRARNKKHDEEVTERFIRRGWLVIRIWECELTKKNREILMQKLSVLFSKSQEEA